MAPRIKDLDDEEILRLSRARVTESAGTTYTEVSLDTQLSVERGVIWLVNFVEFDFQTLHLLTEVGAGGLETVTAQITRESQSGIVQGNDVDLIQRMQFLIGRSAAIGTDAGPLSFVSDTVRRINFPVPVPYAAANIHFGILGTDSTAHTVDFRVGYTIRTVSDKFFFRVAQALIA